MPELLIFCAIIYKLIDFIIMILKYDYVTEHIPIFIGILVVISHVTLQTSTG